MVAYDALVHPDLLSEVRPDAERVYVGKRGYCVGATRQEAIHDVLVDRARAGRSVVRLKGGDPFLFGRGGEELEHLAAHGVRCEVVPGVTAAAGAGAAAGIPLTHRDAGQSVALVTGHFDPDSPACTLDWPALAAMSGVVIYMGLRHLDRTLAKLAEAGLAPDTPAAVVERATLPGMRVVTGDLATLGRLAREADVRAPAVVVVGEGVRLRGRLLELAAARAE